MANGAEQLITTARGEGVELCFANPGTTEMPVVNALDSVGGIRAILGLHENVCTGAADGYGRLAARPALTLLHLGPGFANGVANLHNARRARAPVVNIIGEHARWHLAADPPLAMEIAAVAGTVSAWQRRIADSGGIARDTAEALAAARSRRGAVATLVFPHDLQLAEARGAAPPVWPETFPQLDERRLERAATLLRQATRPALVLGGTALFGEGLAAAGRIARATGAALFAETGFARLEAGRGLPPLQRLPYFPEMAKAALDGFDGVIVAGAKMPVSFFGYADKPARYLEGRDDACALAGQDDDAAGALDALASAIEARAPWQGADGEAPTPPTGHLDPETIGQAVAALQPEDAVVVVTAVSSAAPYGGFARHAPPHTQLALTGGAIGEGPALALGAALARPGQRIINLEADGSCAYILQALWSHVREGLDITTVVYANQRYRILQMELERAGLGNPGPQAMRLTGLTEPALDWVALAQGFGVPAMRVTTADELVEALARSLATPGPMLIEAVF